MNPYNLKLNIYVKSIFLGQTGVGLKRNDGGWRSQYRSCGIKPPWWELLVWPAVFLVGNDYYFGLSPLRVGRVTDGTANCVLLGRWGGGGWRGAVGELWSWWVEKGREGERREGERREGQRWAPHVSNCRAPRRRASITGNSQPLLTRTLPSPPLFSLLGVFVNNKQK